MVRATTRDERARVYIEHTDAYGVVFYANYFAFASNAAEALGRVAAAAAARTPAVSISGARFDARGSSIVSTRARRLWETPSRFGRRWCARTNGARR